MWTQLQGQQEKQSEAQVVGQPDLKAKGKNKSIPRKVKLIRKEKNSFV